MYINTQLSLINKQMRKARTHPPPPPPHTHIHTNVYYSVLGGITDALFDLA